MRATEELRNDHGVLRAKLVLLEELLPLAQAPCGSFRALASSLARCLSCHAEKEELLLGLLDERLPQATRAAIRPLLDQHEGQVRALTVIRDLLATGEGPSTEQAAQHLSRLIAGLREHMATEEEALFPALDQLIGPEQAGEPIRLMRQLARCHFLEEARTPRPIPSPITEAMTINHVLRVHPMARKVLTAFGVDCKGDGCDCVGDLSWRRGIDVDALLLSLNQSLGHRPDAVPVPWVLWDSCDGMMVIDASRRVLTMNPALERLTGQRTKDVAGRSECGVLLDCQDARHCPLADHPEACPGLRAMRRLKPVKEAEYTIRTAAGTRVPVSTSYTPIQLGPGGPVWSLVVLRDARLQKRRERQIAGRATTDPLTGLPNRARFFDAFARELGRTVRSGRPLAVAMADLDGFKAYNDTYGHLAGDALLKSVAGLLPTGLRGSELVARYGGDEFVLLLPDTDAGGALAAAKRLCQVVTQFPLVRAEALSGPPHPTPVTISVGFAVFPDDGDTVEALLGQADRRLYQAKERGRSRIAGPPRLEERRRHPRMALEGPIMVRSLAEDSAAPWREGLMQNLSLAGVYLTILPWKPPTTHEKLGFSVSIPPEQQRAFPFSRLAGYGRVARAEELPQPDEWGRKRWGLALEFGEEVMKLAAHIGNGRE